MSGFTPLDPGAPSARGPLPAVVRDLLVVLGWFVAAGLLGAVIWDAVAPLAAYTRTADSGAMGEEELARQFSATGWYVVIAAATGFLSGLVLLLWRRRNPIVMVLAVGAAGALAAWLMATLGRLLGPSDPQAVLPTVEVGARVPLQLVVEGSGAYFAWPVGALAGALLALLVFESRAERQAREERLQMELPYSG